MRLGIAVPERHVKKDVLDAALEATTRLNEHMMDSGAPTFHEAGHRVKWRPEPPGQEHFDHLGKVLQRGHGDCDDLAPWWTATLRHTGEDPGARSIVYKSGPKRWHAVTKRSDGSIDDPSKWRGMNSYRGPGISGAGSVLGHIAGASVGAFSLNPQLALAPLPDGSWEARADLPYNYIPWVRDAPGTGALDVSMAALHRAPVASQAIAGACSGAVKVGSQISDDEEALDFLEAMAWANEGADWEEICDEFGPELADEVMTAQVGIFKKAGRALGRIARGVTKPASKAFNLVAPAALGPTGFLLAKTAHGASQAVKSRGRVHPLDMAKGMAGGFFGGNAAYLNNPGVKAAAGMFGMKGAADALAKGSLTAEQFIKDPKSIKENPEVALEAVRSAALAAASMYGGDALKLASKVKLDAPEIEAAINNPVIRRAAAEAWRKNPKIREAAEEAVRRAPSNVKKALFRGAKKTKVSKKTGRVRVLDVGPGMICERVR